MGILAVELHQEEEVKVAYVKEGSIKKKKTTTMMKPQHPGKARWRIWFWVSEMTFWTYKKMLWDMT